MAKHRNQQPAPAGSTVPCNESWWQKNNGWIFPAIGLAIVLLGGTATLYSRLGSIETNVSKLSQTSEELEKAKSEFDKSSAGLKSTVDNLGTTANSAKSATEELGKSTAALKTKADDLEEAAKKSGKAQADAIAALSADLHGTIIQARDSLQKSVDRIDNSLDKAIESLKDQGQALAKIQGGLEANSKTLDAIARDTSKHTAPAAIQPAEHIRRKTFVQQVLLSKAARTEEGDSVMKFTYHLLQKVDHTLIADVQAEIQTSSQNPLPDVLVSADISTNGQECTITVQGGNLMRTIFEGPTAPRAKVTITTIVP